MFSVLCAAGGTRTALAADFKLTPSLTLSEEFNDNILESATDKRSDFVTRVQPGVALLYQAPRLSGDLRYNFDYRYYARGSRGDEKIHSLALHGSAALTENFLFVEVSDTLSRVSLDVTRDNTSESLFVNQTDQNTASVSPYLLWRLGEKTVLRTGYRFIDTRYWSSPGVNKQTHMVFADLNYEISAHLNLTAAYSFSKVDTELVRYDEHDVSTGFKYEYADKSFLFGGIGNSWQDFSDSRSVSNLFWNAGVTNDFGFLVAKVEARVQYVEDPLTSTTKQTSYSASLEKLLQHGAVGLSGSYTDYEATQAGLPDRHKAAFNGFWRYELSPRLLATVTATGDRVSQATADDYPYHLSGSAGMSYGFNYDITAGLTYTYVGYRRELDSAADAKQTNRVVVEVRKVF
jgi:hypothetical protein